MKQTSPTHSVIIDIEKCISCGICSSVCMFSVIIMDETTRKPVISSNAPPCSQCGHCETFCPEGVIHLNIPDLKPPNLSQNIHPVSTEQIQDLVLHRRSIRKYLQKPVPRDTIEEILDIVRYAPSAMNLQTVRWQVIYETKVIRNIAQEIISWMNLMITEQRLHEFAIGTSFPYITSEWEKGRDLITHGAPHLLLTYSGNDELTATTDAIIATSYLDLIAPVFNLGSCWTGILKRAADWSPDVLALLDLPEGSIPQTALLIGHPAFIQYSIPERKPVKVRWIG
ncbi:nitroreductase family protein [Methanospirillum sp. J.3.6.1-F.2.7.3]|uniref:Nitroreductase family protein n=1 Tax=Methanospirillum purgamenti TaxID=2834276 RepID=A0A8E7EI16_9EURY|nr:MULTISPECIES: nitroreductase family protein [Methanospirillum]MDX8550778.1 nitroreductase family protein [Methanospirillum hungatei]QVV89983.1 nitroreductase family protein [Methanospirillum sp. J.3.6.1-F.2.7.3]